MTEREKKVLWSAAMISPGFPYLWLKPHLRIIARHLRDEQYLRRREFREGMLRPTKRGLTAIGVRYR